MILLQIEYGEASRAHWARCPLCGASVKVEVVGDEGAIERHGRNRTCTASGLRVRVEKKQTPGEEHAR